VLRSAVGEAGALGAVTVVAMLDAVNSGLLRAAGVDEAADALDVLSAPWAGGER